jgi:hypothetical protein
LNQLPEVRRFILETGNADSYVGVKINFIPHHSPELHVFSEGGEAEVIDMAPLSFDQLGQLLDKYGFNKKELL